MGDKNYDYIIFNKNFKNYDVSNIKISVPKSLSDGELFSEVRYLHESKKKKLYLQTSDVIIKEFSMNIGDQSSAYLTVYIDHKDKFLEVINKTDDYCRKKIWETKAHWKLSDKVPIQEIDKNYIPSLRTVATDYTKQQLKFKIETVKDKYLDLDLFDQDGEELPNSLVKEGYSGKCLILVKAIKKSGDYYSLQLELKQLKVNIPEKIFDVCVISDEEESEERDIYEIYDLYEPEDNV